LRKRAPTGGMFRVRERRRERLIFCARRLVAPLALVL